MESGSPMDVLKRLTVTPPCDDTFCNSTQDNDAYNALRQYAEEWMFNMEILDSECSEKFKDANGKFTMNTSVATLLQVWASIIVERNLWLHQM